MGSTYSVTQIVGKTLVGLTAVPIKRLPNDSAPVVFTAQKGAVIGVVEGYVMPKADRKNFWWEFRDTDGRSYWAEHQKGRYSIKNLSDQGALTLKEEAAAAAAKEETTGDKILTLLKTGLFVGAVAYLGGQFIQSRR